MSLKITIDVIFKSLNMYRKKLENILIPKFGRNEIISRGMNNEKIEWGIENQEMGI